MEPCKIISLWQPWASLIAWGEKRIETRSWGTNYRGRVLIHAAKRWTQQERQIAHEFDSEFGLSAKRPSWPVIPLGAVVAVATIEDCIRHGGVRKTDSVEEMVTYPKSEGTKPLYPVIPVTEQEQAFGDFTSGRFAWYLSNIRELETPEDWSGEQGLRDAPYYLVNSIFAQPTQEAPHQ